MWAPWQVVFIGLSTLAWGLLCLGLMSVGVISYLGIAFTFGMVHTTMRMAKGLPPVEFLGTPRNILSGTLVVNLIFLPMGMQVIAARRQALAVQAEVQVEIAAWREVLDAAADAVEAKDFPRALQLLGDARVKTFTISDKREAQVAGAITDYREGLALLADLGQRKAPAFTDPREAEAFVARITKRLSAAVSVLRKVARNRNERALLAEAAATYARLLGRLKREDEAAEMKAISKRALRG